MYRTYSSEETMDIGEKVSRRVRISGGASVFALKGELGAGKTTFVRGFFRGLGIRRRTPSPTFVIMRRRRIPPRGTFGRASRFINVFHVDAYRLKDEGHLAALGFREILANPRNIVLIEWPERVRRLIPRAARWIYFRHGRKENERRIVSMAKR